MDAEAKVWIEKGRSHYGQQKSESSRNSVDPGLLRGVAGSASRQREQTPQVDRHHCDLDSGDHLWSRTLYRDGRIRKSERRISANISAIAARHSIARYIRRCLCPGGHRRIQEVLRLLG